ncbi:hypothetical protein ACFL1N_02520 [Thermodesulfobacteriota bacterium]
MKCLNHRNANAIGQCSKCGIPVCEICNRSEDEDVLMCEACGMFSTFSAMTQKKVSIDEKRIQKELEDSSKKIKRRSVMLTASVVMALIIVIIEVIWYLSLSDTEFNQSNPSEDYVTSIIMINNAIREYRENHDSKAPDSLETLLGDYLPDNEIWKKNLLDYHYKKITPYKYELIPPLKKDDSIPDILFSDEGPGIVGI